MPQETSEPDHSPVTTTTQEFQESKNWADIVNSLSPWPSQDGDYNDDLVNNDIQDMVAQEESTSEEHEKLTSKRDKVVEHFLKSIFDSLPQHPNASATELASLWKQEVRDKISNLSVTLFYKLQPLVQIMMDQKLAQRMQHSFVVIETVTPSLKEMALRYQRCFTKWINSSDCVSFETMNKRLLGNISIKDMFVLTYFIFCTCQRVKNDNILQLGLVGASTSGKSTIFESCLMHGSHVTTSEPGVGRFQTGSKTVLMFHDVSIRTIASSKDTEKIKTIARTEPTVTKVHGTTYTLPPTFLFYSSNERLMTHRLPSAARPILKGQLEVRFGHTLYPSQVNVPGQKKVSPENLNAVQNRFIEAFVKSPPNLDQSDLPHSGGFERVHAILGLYRHIVKLMGTYQSVDFFSPVCRQYIMHGLAANHAEFHRVFHIDLKDAIKRLISHHIPTSLQANLIGILYCQSTDLQEISN